jgi:hypothetical protein
VNITIPKNLKIPALTMLSAMTLIGCDDRAARIAIDAADRQAEQNREMAQLNREVAAGTSRLVTEDAKARQQALEVHRDLQQERSGLTDGWNSLEAERKQIAQSRRTDSALTAIVSGGGGTLAGLLALALAWLALYRGGPEEASSPVIEVIDVMLDSPPNPPQLPPNPLPGGLLTTAENHPSVPEELL